MIIAPPIRADTETVVDLLVAQLAEFQSDTPRAQVAKAVALTFDDPSRARILVARDGDRLLGVAYVSLIWTLEAGQLAWLEDLYVLPERRDRGVGAAILAEVIAMARIVGATAIDLDVDSTHARAEHLYARAGFQRHGSGKTRMFLDLSLGLSLELDA